MTLSLVYRLKRRRLVTLMLLTLGLVGAASVWGPSLEPAGPVWVERVGAGEAVVLKGPGPLYRISYRDSGLWRETEAYTGEVRAVAASEGKLLVFHGRDYTTYAPGADKMPMQREKWDSFPHLWNIEAAAGGPRPAVFGRLDERTVAAASLVEGKWVQAPAELRRPGAVTDLMAAGAAGGAWLWWREGGAVHGIQLGPEGWGDPRAIEAPADARLAAATVKGVPTLFALRDPRHRRMPVRAFPAGGDAWETTVLNTSRFLGAVDGISIADGDEAILVAARGVSVGRAGLLPGAETELDGLQHTWFRYHPGVLHWFTALAFAGLGMIGIGASLLFERRRVGDEELLEQARLLSTVAPLALRGMAAGIDIFPFWLVAGWIGQGGPEWFALGALACNAAACVYHAVFEIMWNQTPGKMMAGIAVRRLDGAPAEPWRILVRNGVRFFELPLFLVWMVCMVSTKRLQRLGDIVAGTRVCRVVRDPEPGEESA